MAATDTFQAEYQALTEGCGLVDRAGRGRLAVTGAEAKDFLQGQVTNDVEALEPGKGCYAAFLTHKGKMLGDMRVLDFGEELFLSTERVALQELFNMIRRFKLGRDVELHKRTLERGELSLIGPNARGVIGVAVSDRLGADEHDQAAAIEAGASDGLGRNEHDNAAALVAGHPVRLVVTDLGVDVICDAAATDAVRAALEAAGAVPASEEAAEIVRVESGRPRYGVELDDTVIPQEAGLNERAVSFTKGCYLGQETVARLHYRGKPNRHLRALHLSAPAEPGAELRFGDKVVGRLGSVAISPRFGPIGLALVRREAAPESRVAVGGGSVTATVAEPPFIRRQTR